MLQIYRNLSTLPNFSGTIFINFSKKLFDSIYGVGDKGFYSHRVQRYKIKLEMKEKSSTISSISQNSSFFQLSIKAKECLTCSKLFKTCIPNQLKMSYSGRDCSCISTKAFSVTNNLAGVKTSMKFKSQYT